MKRSDHILRDVPAGDFEHLATVYRDYARQLETAVEELTARVAKLSAECEFWKATAIGEPSDDVARELARYREMIHG